MTATMRPPAVVRSAADAVALGTVLAVWAHPDDEAYLCAGLMALARRAGQRVVCVTATPGEHGTSDPEAWPPARLAALRTTEMAAAMAALGVDEHRWLGFEDGTLAAVDPAHGTALIAGLLDEVRPDTVVSFGPDGMTGHPDHQAIAGWVEQAWRGREDGSRLLRTGHLRPLARRVAVGNGVPSLVAASVDTVVTVPDSVIATPDSVLAPITRRR